MRLSLADAMNHPWLLPLNRTPPAAVREPTASPRAAHAPLNDNRPMPRDESAAGFSQHHIPGAYPASQPDRTLQRRRKVLDDAREAGHMPEPSPEMIQRVEQMMRRESESPEPAETRKRKASKEEPMELDGPVAGPSAQAPTPAARNGRGRRGKAPAAARPVAAPRTRARGKANSPPAEEAPPRRSTRRRLQ